MNEALSRRGVIGLGMGTALSMNALARAQGQSGEARAKDFGRRRHCRHRSALGGAIACRRCARTKKAHLAALVSGDSAKAKRTAAQYGPAREGDLCL